MRICFFCPHRTGPRMYYPINIREDSILTFVVLLQQPSPDIQDAVQVAAGFRLEWPGDLIAS